MKKAIDLEFFRKDRRVSITREGVSPDRFEFDKSVQRSLRREKRIASRAARREGKREIYEALSLAA